MFTDDSDRNTAGLSKQSVLMCILGLGLHQSAESLGSLRLFSYPSVFQTFKWSWRNADMSQVIFLSRPQFRISGGQVSQTYKHKSPQTAHRAPVVLVSGTASP